MHTIARKAVHISRLMVFTLILVAWITLFSVFAGGYLAYFSYLKFHVNKPWMLKLDSRYNPPVTVLIPAYNEEKAIQRKLENLFNVYYPKDKLEVIVIDDGSTDQTLLKAFDFAKSHPEFPLQILSQNPRRGKAHALNKALKVSSNQILIVSDADAFWSPSILHQALPYLSDPSIGAVTGRQIVGNDVQSWVAKAEESYLDFMSAWRLGESKLHSTIRFEGVFAAFKKNAFKEFDYASGADDSGTALQVVQNKFRAILVPEVCVASDVSSDLRERTKVKIRRATQLTGLWFQCMGLILKRRLVLPKRIAVPEIFLSIFAPIIFIALIAATVLLVVFSPIVMIPFALILCAIFLIRKATRFLVQGIIDQLVLFYSIALHVRKKRFVTWEK